LPLFVPLMRIHYYIIMVSEREITHNTHSL